MLLTGPGYGTDGMASHQDVGKHETDKADMQEAIETVSSHRWSMKQQVGRSSQCVVGGLAM